MLSCRTMPALTFNPVSALRSLRPTGNPRLVSGWAAHRDEMGDLLSSDEMDWAAAASLFEQAGLLDARGRPPNAATAEATWLMLGMH